MSPCPLPFALRNTETAAASLRLARCMPLRAADASAAVGGRERGNAALASATCLSSSRSSRIRSAAARASAAILASTLAAARGDGASPGCAPRPARALRSGAKVHSAASSLSLRAAASAAAAACLARS